MSNWYAVRTATRQEHKVVDGLHDVMGEIGRRFDVYLPCETQWSRSGRVKTRRQTPLLPGYLFVQVEAGDLWRVERVWGVHGILGGSGACERHPMAVSPVDILVIRECELKGDFDFTKSPPPMEPRKGDKVRVTGGKAMGFAGEILETPRNKRAKLVTALFGRPWVVEVLVSDLEPQDEAAHEAA